MDRERWFERYYDDVILPSYNDEERVMQAHLKYGRLPEVTISNDFDISLKSSELKIDKVPKQQYFTGRKPIIPFYLADTFCETFTVQGLLDQFNTILGTSYALGTAGMHSVLEHCILKKYDFGTAYARLRSFWYGDLTAVVDDLSRREVQYRRMLEDVLVTDRIIYPRVPPRRVWDLYSNRVVPWYVARRRPWAISHAWMDKCYRENVSTAINGHQWPVPIPKTARLDHIRIEMLNLGAEYVWLDVLCLRQEGGPMEDLRVEEWKVDVPTIGSVYAGADKVVCYLSGLGLALELKSYWTEVGSSYPGPRDWFKRAWTLQEISEHMIIGGDTGNEDIQVYAGMELVRLLHSDSIPAYYGTQSEEDAWSSLVDVAAHQCQWDLLFLYPEPGDGTKTWRPSWRQAMSGTLPWREQRHLNHNGYLVESAVVRGLSEERHYESTTPIITEMGGPGLRPRVGQLVVKDNIGKECSFEITASHWYPIPNGPYTLLGSTTKTSSIFWVVGHRLENGKLKKLSVVQMCLDGIPAVSLMDSLVSRTIDFEEDVSGAIQEILIAFLGHILKSFIREGHLEFIVDPNCIKEHVSCLP